MLAYPGRAGDIGVCLAKRGKNERLQIVEMDHLCSDATPIAMLPPAVSTLIQPEVLLDDGQHLLGGGEFDGAVDHFSRRGRPRAWHEDEPANAVEWRNTDR